MQEGTELLGMVEVDMEEVYIQPVMGMEEQDTTAMEGMAACRGLAAACTVQIMG